MRERCGRKRERNHACFALYMYMYTIHIYNVHVYSDTCSSSKCTMSCVSSVQVYACKLRLCNILYTL